MPLRLMVYDATWAGRRTQGFLTSSWIVGGALYRSLNRLDAIYGAHSWTDALAWLCSVQPSEQVSQVQYWGHGKWGKLFIAKEALGVDALAKGHALHDDMRALRARLTNDALFWFRSCETFGKDEGHELASRWTTFFDCRAAGHTYVIGPWQSGLHSLAPREIPRWSTKEGLPEGVDSPRQALMSRASAPNTITCLHGEVPAGW